MKDNQIPEPEKRIAIARDPNRRIADRADFFLKVANGLGTAAPSRDYIREMRWAGTNEAMTLAAAVQAAGNQELIAELRSMAAAFPQYAALFEDAIRQISGTRSILAKLQRLIEEAQIPEAQMELFDD